MVNLIKKDSPIGNIPTDWSISALGEFLDIKTGPFGSALHAEDYKIFGIPIITVEHLSDNGVLHENLPLVGEIDYKRLSPYTLKTGDIVFSRVGSVDRNSWITDKESGWLFSGRLLRLRANTDKCNTRYLSYYFHFDPVKQSVRNIAVGQTMASLNTKLLCSLEAVLPTAEEQTAIAEALSDADSLVAFLEKLIAKKKVIKQGAMQELLTGKKRLTGYGGEWKQLRFGDLGWFYSGLSGKSKGDFGIGSAKYITFLNILTNTVVDKSGFATVSVKENEQQNLVQCGDLFFNTSSETPEEVGMCAALLEDVSNTYLNSFCFGFRLKGDEHDPLFLSYYFNSDCGRKIMFVLAQGATRYNLSKSNFAETIMSLPKKEEQTAICSILSDMDAEIEQLEKKLSKYRLIKQGMMQELLTGRIRLIETDKKAESAPKGHNQHYDDAIAISAIVNAFYDDRFILGRVKVQKLLYLLRRKQDADVSAFKKKAAGPYNEKARYKGGESIAIKSGYIAVERNDKGSKFSKGSSISAALKYVGNMQSDIDWLLEKFRFYNTNKNTKNLEVLATVDMAVCELEKNSKVVNLDAVKNVIRSNKEWAPKLTKPFFADAAINHAIMKSKELFGQEV